MFKIIQNLPDDVLGVEFHGKITHEDYIKGLIPAFDKKFAAEGDLRVLSVVMPDFQGFEIAAMWDDATYGLRHWRDISHIAVVCDQPAWIKNSVSLFKPFFPGAVRSFDMAELEQAKAWISAPEG